LPIAAQGIEHPQAPLLPLCSHARAALTLARREIIVHLDSQPVFQHSLFSKLSHYPLYITPSGILYLDVGTLLAGPSNQDATTRFRIPPSRHLQLDTHNMDVVTRIPELAKQFRVRLVVSEVYSCMF
jgi:hypothetical protein